MAITGILSLNGTEGLSYTAADAPKEAKTAIIDSFEFPVKMWDQYNSGLYIGGPDGTGTTARIGLNTDDPEVELQINPLEVATGTTESAQLWVRGRREDTGLTGGALISVQDWDYLSTPSFSSVNLMKWNSNYTTTRLDTEIPIANLGEIYFTNCDNALIWTNGPTDLIFGTFSEERMRIDGDGYVGIGTSGNISWGLEIKDFANDLQLTSAQPYIRWLDTSSGTKISGQIIGVDDSLYIDHGVSGNDVGAILFRTNLTGEKMRIDWMGRVGIGGVDSISTFNDGGLCIDQGANDDECFSLKSSDDVAHGITAITETDTYFAIQKLSPTAGCAMLRGFGGPSGIGVGLWLEGVAATPEAAGTGADGSVTIRGYKKSGTTVAAPVAGESIFAVQSSGATRFVIEGDGGVFAATGEISAGAGDLLATALDNEDDVALVRTFERTMHNDLGIAMSKWDEQITANAEDLKRVGVLTKDEGLYNMQRMNSLLGGAIWQQHVRHKDLEAALCELVPELENKLNQQRRIDNG